MAASTRTIIVVAVVIFLLLWVIALAIALGIMVNKYNSASSESSSGGSSAGQTGGSIGEDVCDTSECLQVAAYVSSNMDTNVDPCEDFYTYSCGGWMKKNYLKPGYTYLDVRKELDDKNTHKLEQILLQDYDKNAPEHEKKLKILYKTCMDEMSHPTSMENQIKSYINDSLGGWYGFDPNVLQNWDFGKALSLMHGDLRIPKVLFMPFVAKSYTNKTSYHIDIQLPGVITGSWQNQVLQLLDKKVQVAFRAYVSEMGKLLMGDNVDQLRLDTFTRDAFDMEITVAKLMNASFSRRENLDTTVGELVKRHKLMPWRTLLDHFYGPFQRSGDDEKIFVRNIYYYDQFNNTLAQLGSEQNRILNNYLVFRFIHGHAPGLSLQYKMLRNNFNKAYKGTFTPERLDYFCYKIVKNYMSQAFDAEFVKYNLQEKSRNEVEEMYKEIKKTVLSDIENIPWMDAETIKKAKGKIESVPDIVGSPPYLAEDEQDYKDLDIKLENPFLTNLIECNRYYKKALRRYLTHKETPKTWWISAASTWVGYSRFDNTVHIPSGIIQKPYYWNISTPAHKYGGIGSTMGWYWLPSVDQWGRYHDLQTGQYNKSNTWWSGVTETKWNSLVGCMKEYLSGVTAGPFDLGNGEQKTFSFGIQSLVEYQIKETAGVTVSYKAYKSRDSSKESSKRLPVLNLSNDQLFFVASAQTKCRVDDRDALIRSLKNGWIIPNKNHINSLVAQLDEFQQAFQCPKNAKLNPENKCKIF